MKSSGKVSDNNKVNDSNARELMAIKKLLVLLLLKIGTKQEEIGGALQLDRTTISKWFKDIEIEKICLNNRSKFMATNCKIKAALLSRLGCSPQALSQRVNIQKKKYGPMSTEDAVYLIAHNEGIDLSKYLKNEIVDSVRGLIHHKGAVGKSPVKVKLAGERTVIIKINSHIPEVDVMLSTSLAEDMKRMAQLYPLQYMLENSLRVVIQRVLEKRYGAGWWEDKVNEGTKGIVKGRKEKEAKQPWHGRRGQHQISIQNLPT